MLQSFFLKREDVLSVSEEKVSLCGQRLNEEKTLGHSAKDRYLCSEDTLMVL